MSGKTGVYSCGMLHSDIADIRSSCFIVYSYDIIIIVLNLRVTFTARRGTNINESFQGTLNIYVQHCSFKMLTFINIIIVI